MLVITHIEFSVHKKLLYYLSYWSISSNRLKPVFLITVVSHDYAICHV